MSVCEPSHELRLIADALGASSNSPKSHHSHASLNSALSRHNSDTTRSWESVDRTAFLPFVSARMIAVANASNAFRPWLWMVSFLVLSRALAPCALAADTPVRTGQQDRKNILVLGDSLAAGYGLEPAQAFPALLQEKIDAADLPFEVINAGVSGDTSAGGLRRIDWLLRRKVDVLLLELGGNDGLRGLSLEMTKTNLQTIIERTKAKYPSVKIIVAGMEMPTNMGPEYVKEFRAIFAGLAKISNVSLIPFLLDGVGGRTDLNQPDRIHPTAEGQKVVAENAWKVLKPLIEKMGDPRNNNDKRPAPLPPESC